ncbi:polysaccharide deacetylase family protein [Paludifilum halophilum]|uniref:NodB homology domain-containing protein n=1 Tax=Paludifilum halophilum TaxID=1642702 RepID=A0A235BB08_9BACL|nr:polysaccharide deacetylase family protein [Paludifilum halophilum]OYD09488.1 hypothetical protein CHM34_00250 [Paludifilum halophilum]
MNERRLRKRWLLLVIPLIGFVVYSPSVTAYVNQVKEGKAQPVFQRDELKDVIEQGARVRNEPPVDARVDPVWKAIPGYNGLAVDVESTYRLAKRMGQTRPVRWIMEEVTPKVSLDDLDAQPIYRGNEKKPMAALMINVAWGTEHLPGLLDILKREGISATFFLDGSWLKKHPEMAEELRRQGHEVGNHAYSHPLMSRISRERIRTEIQRTEALIQQSTGDHSRFFAPPAGDFNQNVLDEARHLGMKTVLWTVDTVDWKKSSSPEWMTARVKKGVGRGSLILMHPTDRTVKALPKIISTVKNKGIKLGTVNQVLSSKRVESVEPMDAF